MALPKKARRELRKMATDFGVLDPLWFKDMHLEPPEKSLDASLLDMIQAIGAAVALSGLLPPKGDSDEDAREETSEENRRKQLTLFGT